MYVYRHHTGRYYARHFVDGNPHHHSHLISGMSDEHRRQSEYGFRAAVDHGLDAMLERSTGNGTRLDLAVVGARGFALGKCPDCVERNRVTRRGFALAGPL
jgi:hypothetical protein